MTDLDFTFDLSWAVNHPDGCHTAVTRDGTTEPCDKPAVALATDSRYPEEPYPVCAHHTRKDTAVPLTDWIGLIDNE